MEALLGWGGGWEVADTAGGGVVFCEGVEEAFADFGGGGYLRGGWGRVGVSVSDCLEEELGGVDKGHVL